MTRTALNLLVGALLACLLPAAASAKPKPKPKHPENPVRVFSSGDRSELVKKLPITARKGAEPRQVMRIGAGRTPGFRSGDVLRAGVELQLTNSCIRPEPRCVGPTYGFSPRVEAKLLLRGPGGSRRWLGSGREICGQRDPHREHHCVLVIEPSSRQVGKRSCKKCKLSLIVSAHHPKADGSERILVGGNRPDGSIPQDRGRITATLLRREAPRPRISRTQRLQRSTSPMDKRRHVVVSKRLRGLRRGEQLEVAARLRTDISRLPYSVRTTTQLVLARSPRAVHPDRRTKRISLSGGEIDESNGFNCLLPAKRCTSRKIGVSRLRRSAKRLYLNLVLLTGPKRATAAPAEAAQLGPARMIVRRYPPPK